ncbi:hypothetical protein DFH09DRAFT_1094127 [Mycena vulgaris]|nr:hypothetical protein DFH09DRAFT_1094127 [Mycena vulgaris]
MRHKTLCAAAQIAPATGSPYPDTESDQVGVIVPTPQDPTANSTDVPPAEHNSTRDDPTDIEDLTSGMGVPQPSSVDLKIAGDIDDGVNSLENMLFEGLFFDKASRPMITVNFSNDLSLVKQLPDPADYFKEVEAIARIQQEVKPRVTKARALAIKPAADKDAEFYDEWTRECIVHIILSIF